MLTVEDLPWKRVMSYDMAIAQLRHAYKLLKTGQVSDYKQFADGLLSPAIEALERDPQ